MILQTVELRQWVPHLQRAFDEKIDAWQRPTESYGEDYQVWSATSGTIPGLLYTIEYTADAEGQHGKCDCEAGKSGQLCKHIAFVAGQLRIFDYLEVAGEAERIKLELHAEREKAQAQKASIKAAEKLAAEAAQFEVGKWVRVNDARDHSGRKGVIERVHVDGMLRVTLEATKTLPAKTIYIAKFFTQPYKRPAHVSKVTPEAQEQAASLLVAS